MLLRLLIVLFCIFTAIKLQSKVIKMRKEKDSIYIPVILVLMLIGGFISSCANMARPGGGPKDETPPVFVNSDPLPKQIKKIK